MNIIKFLALAGQFSTTSPVGRLASIITTEEINNNLLSKETMAKLGLKGSPKLSKVLIRMGLDANIVSTALSKKKGTTVSVSANSNVAYDDERYVLEQGDSIHFSSCQAIDLRAQWYKEGGSTDIKVDKDLIPFGKSLFIWYSGNLMSEDGEGFTARAKLRVMYDNAEVAGLYVDRPYGQYYLLLDDIYHLQEWWDNYSKSKGWYGTPILMPPVWNRPNGHNSDFQSLFGGRYHKKLHTPSSCWGYQDTLDDQYDEFDFFHEATTSGINNPLVVAYKGLRNNPYGLAVHPMSAVRYNPQKGGFVFPRVEVPKWRGLIKPEVRMAINTINKLMPSYISKVTPGEGSDFDFEMEVDGERLLFSYSAYNDESYFISLGESINVVFSREPGSLQVSNDVPELGFYKAEDCSYQLVAYQAGLPALPQKKGVFYAYKQGQVLAYGNRRFRDIISRDNTSKITKVKVNLPECGLYKAIPLPTMQVSSVNADGECKVLRGNNLYTLYSLDGAIRYRSAAYFEDGYSAADPLYDPHYTECRLYTVEYNDSDELVWGEKITDRTSVPSPLPEYDEYQDYDGYDDNEDEYNIQLELEEVFWRNP